MISGHGGQGVLDLGNYIAYQALRDGYRVVYTPTYGPESRGGKVRCWVTFSSDEIDSPVAEILDVLLILNKPSMDFVPQLRPGGLLLYNQSIIDREPGRDDIVVRPIPCTELAGRLADDLDPAYAGRVDVAKALNCVMYGGYLAQAGWKCDKVLKEAEQTFNALYRGRKKSFITLNLAGVRKGFDYMEQHHGPRENRAAL